MVVRNILCIFVGNLKTNTMKNILTLLTIISLTSCQIIFDCTGDRNGTYSQVGNPDVKIIVEGDSVTKVNNLKAYFPINFNTLEWGCELEEVLLTVDGYNYIKTN